MVAHFLSGAVSPVGARWIPAHLLLLPRRVLQSVLGRSARVYRRRTTHKLLGRALVPAHHAKCASLFSLSCLVVFNGGRDRPLESGVVCRRIWNRCRNDC